MSVVFPKVTHGFCSEWGRDLLAAVRSGVNTGKRQGLSAFEAIRKALSAPLVSLPPVEQLPKKKPGASKSWPLYSGEWEIVLERLNYALTVTALVVRET